jgi:hypothetical protein
MMVLQGQRNSMKKILVGTDEYRALLLCMGKERIIIGSG